MKNNKILKIVSLISGLFLLGTGVFAQNLMTTASSVDSGVVFYGTAGVVNKSNTGGNSNTPNYYGFKPGDILIGEGKGEDTLPITSNDLLDCEGPSLIEHAHDMHFWLDACRVADNCPFKAFDVLTLDQKGVTINTQFVSPTCAWVGTTTINSRTFQNGPFVVNGSERLNGALIVNGPSDFYGDLSVFDNAGNEMIKANATNGTLFAHDIIVQASNFPDYVFSPDYVLPSMEAFRNSIEKHHHLPLLSSAALYETQGLSLYQLNKQLVEQVEVLALYLLQQEKEVAALKNELNDLTK
jgi:hypothetical protein